MRAGEVEDLKHAYGTNMGIRDPFGDGIRILQPARFGQKVTA